MTDYAVIVERIRSGANQYSKRKVIEACEDFITLIQATEPPVPADPLRKVLVELRRSRYFDLMERVGDVGIQSGQDDPKARRFYAQGLIDSGKITAAVNVLALLALETAEGPLKNPAENAEARGLLGRTHKQAYVNAVNPPASDESTDKPSGDSEEYRARARANRKHLERAVKAYFEVYDSARTTHLWHGINVVACLARAQRDGIPVEGYPAFQDIAAAILDHLSAVPEENVAIWDRATAVEACIALNRREDALNWLAIYAPNPGADAFELGSTLRQLREVWQLTSADPLGSVLTILRSELLRREGGAVDIPFLHQSGRTAVAQEMHTLEAVLGDTRFLALGWYREGLRRFDGVAKIETKYGEGFGSGCLIRGEDLHAALTGETLLLTRQYGCQILNRETCLTLLPWVTRS